MNSKMDDRRKIGIKTAIIALIIAITEGTLSLIRTREILFAFGDSTNAIMQVAVQITAYLTLIESGMTAAYQLRLYQPLAQKEIKKISSLYLGLRNNMRSIVLKMLVISNVGALIYVFFLLNLTESKVYAFSIFFIMGLRFVSPYLFTLQERTILIASEKGYVSTAIQGVSQCTTLVLEILLCRYTALPLAVILFSYIIAVLISKRIYVYYRKSVMHLNFDTSVEPDIEPTEMTKDILIHQICGMITSNTDNILLSIMSSLTNVTIYSSFYTVMNYPVSLFNSIIGSMKASIVIKIQMKEKNAFELYENTLKLSCLVMSVVAAVFFVQVNQFIKLWIGEKYILNNSCIAMLSFILFMQVVLNVLTIGIDAAGMYKETKKYAFAQALVNLVLTLILIPFLGITGALIGTVISIAAVKLPFMGKTVYKDVFHVTNGSYKILISGLFCTISAIIPGKIVSNIGIDSGWISFLLSSIYCSIICSLTALIWYTITDNKMMQYFLTGNK